MDDTLHSRIREQLHGVGLRMTPTRAALLRLLLELGGPITHADIVDRLSAEFVDRSTVFRVLQDFISAGLVRRLDIGDHKWRYELIRESALSESDSPLHPHLLCDECGKVFCLSEEEVQFSVPATGLVVREVLLRGSCTDCFANSQSAGSERGNQK